MSLIFLSLCKGVVHNYYFHLNDRKDVIKITDDNQNIVASYEYDAFGNIISSSGSFASEQPFRYASYYYDSSTQLYYLINRYYDPKTGRFISKDKFRKSNPDSLDLNPYLYVKNNPVNKTDASGYGAVDNKRLATAWLARPDLQAFAPQVNPRNYNSRDKGDHWGRLSRDWAEKLNDSNARWVMNETGAIPPDVDPDRLGTVWKFRSDLQGVFPVNTSIRTGTEWNRLENWARENWDADPYAWWALSGKDAPIDYGSGIVSTPALPASQDLQPIQDVIDQVYGSTTGDTTPPTQTAPAPVPDPIPDPPKVDNPAPPATPGTPINNPIPDTPIEVNPPVINPLPTPTWVLKRFGPLRVVYGNPRVVPVSVIAELEGKAKYYGTALTIDEYERSVKITLPTGSSYKIDVWGRMEGAVPKGGYKFVYGWFTPEGSYVGVSLEREFNIDFLQVEYSNTLIIRLNRNDIRMPPLKEIRERFPFVPIYNLVPIYSFF